MAIMKLSRLDAIPDHKETQPMQQSSPPTFTSPASKSDETTWAVVAHVGALAGYVIPFGHILAPLLVLLAKGKTSAFVDAHAKESLNFQISLTLYTVVAFALAIVLFVGGALAMTLGSTGEEGIPFVALFMLLFPAYIFVAVFELVVIIVAAVRASNGQPYRYPLTVRLVK